MTQDDIFDMIREERERFQQKWEASDRAMIRREMERGVQEWIHSAQFPMFLWHLILSEEIGEVSKAIQSHDVSKTAYGVAKVATVAVACLEDLYALRHEEWLNDMTQRGR